MPFINTKTNISISKEQEQNIKSKLRKAISILGKSESWLMLNFEDNNRMYFRGENNFPMAFVAVDLYGRASSSSYNSLTSEITTILNEELGIDNDKIYVKYSEIDNWGWNGNNL